MPSGRADLSEDEAIVQAQRTSRSWFQRREMRRVGCCEQRRWDGNVSLSQGFMGSFPIGDAG